MAAAHKRFWAKVRKADGCWEWTGSTNNGGYGQFRMVGSPVLAHRVSYAMHFGETPLCVLHRCDNRLCVNPDHLFAGTQADNMGDAARKGRLSVPRRHTGSARPKARRWTDEQVAEMRRAVLVGGERRADVARRFGVNPSYVSRVVAGLMRKYSPGLELIGGAR